MSEKNAVYKGVVVEPRDPKRRGRLRVFVPELGNEVWARRATLDAGHERGTWFVPDEGDEVLVAFENGDPRKPIVIGALWGSTQKPPESKPERTLVRTKHGATVILDDGTGGVEVSDLHGNVVKLAADGITVHSGSRLTVKASSSSAGPPSNRPCHNVLAALPGPLGFADPGVTSWAAPPGGGAALSPGSADPGVTS